MCVCVCGDLLLYMFIYDTGHGGKYNAEQDKRLEEIKKEIAARGVCIIHQQKLHLLYFLSGNYTAKADGTYIKIMASDSI